MLQYNYGVRFKSLQRQVLRGESFAGRQDPKRLPRKVHKRASASAFFPSALRTATEEMLARERQRFHNPTLTHIQRAEGRLWQRS
jgi:hypothetical protein